MRVALATCGSRGDVQPFIALGRAFLRAGHEVVLCAPDDFASFAAEHGLPFRAIGHDFESQLREMGDSFRRFRQIAQLQTEEQLAALPAALEGAELVVGTGILLTGFSVAELLKIPYRFVCFFPGLHPSRYYAPPVFPGPPTRRWINAPLWSLYSDSWNWVYRKRLDAWRARVGLGPCGQIFPRYLSERPLIAADPLLAPLAPDVEGRAQQVGALMLEDSQPLPPEVEAFLAAGEPPVYIGFGSMGDADPARTTREVVEAVRMAGVRAIISRGWARLGGEALPPEVLAIGPVSHQVLLPRLRAMVHHGGAGTTHAAARAGIPQVIIPHVLDQFYWAHRLHALGVAPRLLPRKKLSASSLAEALRWCLRPEPQQRARELARQVRTDGSERAVEVLTVGLGGGTRPAGVG